MKINLFQLAQLLPMEENFLLLFRFDNPLESSVEFMKVNKLRIPTKLWIICQKINFPINFSLKKKQIWREYDSDNSGYIEADELKNFLRDLLREAKKINDVSEDKLIEYTDTMVFSLCFPFWWQIRLIRFSYFLRYKIFFSKFK